MPLGEFPLRRGTQFFCCGPCMAAIPELAPRNDPQNVYFEKPKAPLWEELKHHSDNRKEVIHAST